MDDLTYCIQYLAKVNQVDLARYFGMKPFDLFRSLMNITMPTDLSEEYYQKQDSVLKETLAGKTVTDVSDLPVNKDGIAIYQGDITLLKADAIVNACNEKMLGCFSPLHRCIDNAIHSFAGLQVRRDMMKIMAEQDHDEPNGQCKVSKGYNLPATYIFHTVGPQVYGGVTKENEEDLRNCYLSCLKKMDEMGLHTIVFCSISTGVYGFPKVRASEIAYETVKEYLKNKTSITKVVFDVFGVIDYAIYSETAQKFN